MFPQFFASHLIASSAGMSARFFSRPIPVSLPKSRGQRQKAITI